MQLDYVTKVLLEYRIRILLLLITRINDRDAYRFALLVSTTIDCVTLFVSGGLLLITNGLASSLVIPSPRGCIPGVGSDLNLKVGDLIFVVASAAIAVSHCRKKN